LVALFIVAMLLFAAVVGRVAILQTTGSDALRAAGKAQRTTESVLYARRGTIFARDGGELSLSVPSATIIANPKLVQDAAGTVTVLANMLGLSIEKQKSLYESFLAKEKSFAYVARQVDDGLADAVLALDLPGIDMIQEDMRIMPSGEVGRSVLGRTDIDGKGIAGIEMQYDELLTGVNGERVREHDREGHSIPGADAVTRQPVPGDDLVLTLDRSLQFQVEQALVARVEELKAEGGTVVVMDVATGEIYSLANVKRGDDGTAAVTSANLAAVEAFEPGSVAKVFSISSVLDTGSATPDTTIEVPGTIVFDKDTEWEMTINDAERHGLQPMTLHDIIVHSSNIGTLLLSERVGVERLGDYMNAFGFGEPTALDFPGESSGLIKPADELQGTEKATITFGYGYSATALQLAAAVNVVANGGVYVAPKLLLATIGDDGEVVATPPSPTRQVLQPQTAATMTSLMTDVVCQGTGKGARIDGLSVAGKTGTAYKLQEGGTYGEAGDRQYRATFVGFFPAQNPQVTILVTIDQPDPTSRDRFGGTAAAPLFTTVATAAVHQLQVMPTPGDTGCAG
jgi:cell division protein FtsI (penicillin-binding protein 3)